MKRNQGKNSFVIQKTPRLENGINLLKSDESPIQRIVAEQLRLEGEAVWIDSGNESSTYKLAEHGNEELLRRVKVARSFTPFQHHTAVDELDEFVGSETEVLVLSNVDLLYIDGQLNREEAEELFAETMEKAVSVAEKYGLKVLVTAASEDLEFKLRVVSDNVIESEKTREGRKFSSNSFETRAFQDSGMTQTRLNMWNKEVKTSGKDERHVQKPSRQHS